MEENFLSEYSNLLDDTSKHLSYETIALFLNFNNNLSTKEKNFITGHINSCQECFEKFKEVFDDDFEMDEAKESVAFSVDNVITSSEEEKKFSKDAIEFTLRKVKENVALLFNALPGNLVNSRIRVTIPDSDGVARIISAKVNKQHRLFSPQPLELSSVENVVLEIFKEPAKPLSKKSISGNKAVWYSAAAAVVIAIGAFFILSGENNNEGNKRRPPVVEERKPVIKKKEDPQKLNPSLFVENRTMENFIERNLRSEGEFKIINPAIGDTISTHVKFMWSEVPRTKEYKITLLTNRNIKIWERRTDYYSITYLDKLDPGLYYWKIEADGKMMGAGKFIIK